MKRLSLIALVASAHFLAAQTTTFTYQGRLDENGTPAEGIYDLRFTIYDAPSGGTALSSDLISSGVGVTNGLFAVPLDFGAAIFDSNARFMELGVRTNGGSAFVTLVPRKELTSSPYAIRAANVNSSGIDGLISDSQISTNIPRLNGTSVFTGSVSFTSPGAPFAVSSGSKVTNLNADFLDGLDASAFWKTGGNSGTFGGTHFLGTTDDQALELKVNNSRALRLEPNAMGAPNVIGGSIVNYVAPGVFGATIAGGGAQNYGGANVNAVNANFGTVGGGAINTIRNGAEGATIAGGSLNTIHSNATHAVISGGFSNQIENDSARTTIGGGLQNTIRSNSTASVVGGGHLNSVSVNSSYSVIGGGRFNAVIANAAYSTIAGGENNRAAEGALHSALGGGRDNLVEQYSLYSTVAGGYANLIGANALASAVGGGNLNRIESSAWNCTIGGGYHNIIRLSPFYSTIAGGKSNLVEGASSTIAGGEVNSIWGPLSYGTIGGGRANVIHTNSTGAVISGGEANTILPVGQYATIPGGYQNTAARYSFAAGYRAKATNLSTFVWSDGSPGDFGSTAANQFLIQASAGVGINKNNPSSALDVNGTVTATSFNGSFNGNGAAITNLSPANLTGTLPDSKLSSNVPLLNKVQTFTGFNTFSWLNAADGTGPTGSGGRLHIGGYTASGDPKLLVFGDGDLVYIGENGFDDRMQLHSRLGFYFTGGFVGIGVTNPSTPLHVNGTVTAASYNTSSDREAKEDFSEINAREILEKVTRLPIQGWKFKGDETKHLGPMAQDFHAAFNLGTDEKHIATVDADGVALAAIQGLNEVVQEKDARIAALEQQNSEMAKRLGELERIVTRLAKQE